MLYMFSIESQNIQARQIMVNTYYQSDSKGAVILGTGEFGNSFYSSYGQPAINTITTLYDAGYEIYELKWLGDNGWQQMQEGLAKYDMEGIFTMVVLSGGPPVSDLRNGIFCDGTDPVCWPDGIGGFQFTDYLMGWDGNGDYCYYREAPEYIQAQLDPVSLVTNLDIRDYHYSTFVNFVPYHLTLHS